jgi:predicted CoA-substrate-specific enzyme activase
MSDNNTVLGIDIGSVSLSAVEMDHTGQLLQRVVVPHEGDVRQALKKISSQMDWEHVRGCAATGQNISRLSYDRSYDSRMACIRSVKERFPEAGAILLVGGEQFSLIRFDREGHYQSIRTNTSCAAGTGSFLDQQAGRLNMTDSAELSSTAVFNEDPVPLVATRCAVFAKTDLIHAQQEGYSLSGISEGLCQGLAANLVDTLFKDNDLNGPVLFTGGVSLNKAVYSQISSMIDTELITDPDGACQGAIGAALSLLDELRDGSLSDSDLSSFADGESLFRNEEVDRSGFYPPLALNLSDYPDFSAYMSWDQPIKGRPGQPFVEVELFESWPGDLSCYIGIDIGSTSTKAVVCSLDGQVLGGFYTRTAGRPLEAVQALFEALTLAAEKENAKLRILGSATTGSGRKFIGKLIHADVILDEISAHARAACELDPEVDTILEIGGQDAKFTTLKNGRVTLSVMNNVCAAGTGSFLEEQASRLGVSIRDYADMADGVQAPGVSDRCTVFMERDINHLLAEGCSVPEVLAAALHAVRENYLRKVAVENNIGNKVFFQGATARNRSLVAAFEQKLNKPILVSPFCHLTGALGAALTLADDKIRTDNFIGTEFYQREVPLRREVCKLCGNHCKLTIADLDGRSVAFGFLCGRDYETESFVNKNSSGWDLLKERNRADKSLSPVKADIKVQTETPLIGIPDALYLTEDRVYWEIFFRELGIPVKSSRGMAHPIKTGKPFTGAEFCAPISALHGHAVSLLKECDYLFMPVYLEKKRGKNGELRKFCYFTQFASSLIAQIGGEDRVISPLASTRYSSFQLISELYHAFQAVPGLKRSVMQISSALDRAEEFRKKRDLFYKSLYKENKTAENEVDVVLLGRPYSVLPPEMNKGIPDIFGSLGIKVFYQDMLDYDQDSIKSIAPLLKDIPWTYGAKILESAEVVARTPGLYPVLITSFKCGPDSFITEYVKKILDRHEKPYLILELDEHDSSVGYETRIEAALRSFNNHLSSEKPGAKRGYEGINPSYLRELSKHKNLVIPNWDDYAVPLIASVLNHQGYKTFAMEETDETIRQSLKWNNGQCIPMNVLVNGFAATLEKYNLKPEDTILWIPGAEFSCNIRMFPHQVQELFKSYGNGLEKAKVYLGQMTYIDLSPLITANAYLAYMFSGLIRRIACRIRPYEQNPGQTDRAVEQSLAILKEVFAENGNKAQAVQDVIQLFEWIPYDRDQRRPKVALFGDVYVRDNPVMNQDVIHYIEQHGGEVVTMPYHEYTRMTVENYFHRWTREMKFGRLLKLKPIMGALATMEKWYYKHFEKVLEEPVNQFDENPEKILEKFSVRVDHEGESQDNLLKTWYISRQYPDLSLFVQLNPGFCCAGLVTEAMSQKIRDVTGVPVLSITYDGTGGLKNDAIVPYLKYPANKKEDQDLKKSM